MADLVDVGIIFMRVFGRDRAWDYFRHTVIEPEVSWRVIRARSRGSPPEVDPERGPGTP